MPVTLKLGEPEFTAGRAKQYALRRTLRFAVVGVALGTVACRVFLTLLHPYVPYEEQDPASPLAATVVSGLCVLFLVGGLAGVLAFGRYFWRWRVPTAALVLAAVTVVALYAGNEQLHRQITGAIHDHNRYSNWPKVTYADPIRATHLTPASTRR